MPGSVYVTSVSAARRHGVYAIERTSPPSIQAIGTGTCAIIAQFPWGPSQKLTTPSGLKNLYNQIAPAGFDRTWSGYLSLIRKGWPEIQFVRVLGPTAAPATATLATNVVVVGLYKGSSGNSLLATVANATDGDPNHFDLSVTVTGASGVTTDMLRSINFSGVGPDSVVSLAGALLTGSVKKTASGRPPNGTYAFSGGLDGTVDAGAYTGTQGAADRGIALFETDGGIRHVFSDDPGNAMRPSVNGALRGHAESLGDRVAYVNGAQGQGNADVKSDVGNYRSVRTVYVDPWPFILDDTDGTKRLVPPAPFAASIAAQLSPSTSIAWKDPEVLAMLEGIVDLEADRVDAPLLFVIDGGKGIRKALGDVFGDRAVVQRCQVHKARNVRDHLPLERRAYVRRQMNDAYKSRSAKTAKKLLLQLVSWLEANGEDAAAASLREGLDETLTVLRLNLPPTLCRTFATTNAIENMNGTLRRIIRHVKRWQGETMIKRWVALGIVEAQRGFRRVKGHGQMNLLLSALCPKEGVVEEKNVA
jgi:hypothetical protein